ncbi:hypothetical protein [Phaeospirillum tilakii]|uniref:Uncharacterized protein n=1 Tax=Phaeospirillum tilakii TaxID=741673 RepID=A0ABW5CF80_9PROT
MKVGDACPCHRRPRVRRTGRLAHVRRTVFTQMFNVSIDDKQTCLFVELGVIDQLQSMVTLAVN